MASIEFGERLNELLINNKISIEKLQMETNIPLSVIYKYLRGEIYPSTSISIKPAEYFSYSLDYLLSLTDVFF